MLTTALKKKKKVWDIRVSPKAGTLYGLHKKKTHGHRTMK